MRNKERYIAACSRSIYVPDEIVGSSAFLLSVSVSAVVSECMYVSICVCVKSAFCVPAKGFSLSLSLVKEVLERKLYLGVMLPSALTVTNASHLLSNRYFLL